MAQSFGYQQLTVAGTSIGFATVPPGAEAAHIVIETAAIRWRDDGVAPTGAVGMPMAAGDELMYVGDLSSIRFIRQSGSAVLNVTFYSVE